MTSRPLSPHLFIYRFAYTMATSIFHRATGLVLAAGILLLVAGLASLASGPQAYERFAAVAASWPVKVLLGLWVASFCYHLANGIRHLCFDLDLGFERAQARRSAKIVLIVTILAAAALIYLFFFRGAAS